MWLGSTQLLDKIICQDILVLGTRITFSDTAHDLAVITDHELSLAAHVLSICRSGNNQLRQLEPVVLSLPVNATKMLVQVFILCHLDYCNSQLYGVKDQLLCRMQSVQNMAACLVTGARRLIMSHLCYGSCIGCQFGIKSPSRLQVWFTNH